MREPLGFKVEADLLLDNGAEVTITFDANLLGNDDHNTSADAWLEAIENGFVTKRYRAAGGEWIEHSLNEDTKV